MPRHPRTCCLIAFLLASAAHAAETIALFSGDRGAHLAVVPVGSDGARRRAVNIRPDAIAALRDRTASRIDLPLFADADFTAVVDSSEAVGSSRVHSLRIEGRRGSGGVLSVNSAALFASVFVPGKGTFQVKSRVAGDFEISQLGPPRECGDCPVPILPPAWAADGASASSSPAMAADGAALRIDVMVLYTPRARAQAGGVAAMQALIAAAVADANGAYANSRIDCRLRLAHNEEINYDESAGMRQSLDAITSGGSPAMVAARALRDVYHADLVCLMTWDDDISQPAGLAWILSPVSLSFAPFAYSVVNSDYAVGNHSFAHELGHNQGCDHNRANASGGAYSFSYGYRFAGDDSQLYRTIMAYDATPGYARIAYFSNPSVRFQGHATGVDESASNAADNAKTIDRTAATVAAFRNSAPSIAWIQPGGDVDLAEPATLTLETFVDDDGNMSKVQFFDGATLIGSDSSPPYRLTWTANPGVHVLTAKAIDSEPLTADSSPITVTVNHPPRIVITAPVSGSHYPAPATVPINVNVTDLNGDGTAGVVTKVEFQSGPEPLGTVASPPFAWSWPALPPGNHTLTARAYDAQFVSTLSDPVVILVGGPRIVSESRLWVDADGLLSYRIEAAMTNILGGGAVSRFELRSAVAGMSIDPAAGILSFAPIQAQIGQAVRAPLRVTAVVNGADAGYDEQDVLIHVIDPAMPDSRN